MIKKIAVLILIMISSVLAYSAATEADSSAAILKENFYNMKMHDTLSLEKILTEASKNPDLTGVIEDLAFYNIDFDFSKYLNKSKFKNEYEDLRKTIKEESFEKNKNDIFSLQALILSRRFDEYRELKKSVKNSKETDYLDLLCALFSSDFEEYQKVLSIYLSKYKENRERPFLTRYFLMTSYISDGEIFLQLFKKNYDKAGLLASIIAKNTPLMYELSLMKNNAKITEEIREAAKANELYAAEIILIDYYYGILNKNEINDFVLKYPKFPLNQFLMELE